MNLNATLIVQVISFLLLMFLMAKLLYRPLQDMLDERINKVKSDLEGAQKLLSEAEANRRAAQEMVHKAKEDAEIIRRKAEQAADAYYREQVLKTKEEMQRLIEDANSEIAEQVKRAKEALREEVVNISIEVASKILRREVRPEEHEQIIREAIEGIVER